MRKFTLTVLLLCAVLFGYSQYYYTAPIGGVFNTGNPHGLMEVVEQPGANLGAAWTLIQGTSAAAAWSPNQTIPFTFSFNGSAATEYKVSTTGVLTFDVGTALAAPPEANTNLPSAMIPDMSVCAWGMQATGGNDGIYTSTIGTAGSQQHWIFFASMSNSADPDCWHYWAIVLEEGTDHLFVVDMRYPDDPGCDISMTLGVQTDGTTAIEVTGSPNINHAGNGDPGAADNIYYEFIQGIQPDWDIAVTGLPISDRTLLSAGATTIQTTVVNPGAMTVTSYDFNYKVNGGATQTTAISTSLQSQGLETANHTIPWTPAATGEYAIEAWISNPNGNTDANTTNNNTDKAVAVLVSRVPHKTFIEEATGTWCGWCPRGHVFMDQMHADYPNGTVLAAVHNGRNDPMANSTWDAAVTSFTGGGWPNGLINRAEDPDPSDFPTRHQAIVQNFIPFATTDVTVTYDAATRAGTATVSATFQGAIDREFRLNAAIIEDNITGSGSGYAQVNYYTNNSRGPMGGYESLADPVPAADMVYRFVGRELLGGANGMANSVTQPTVESQTYSQTFNFTLDASYNEDEIYIAGMIANFGSGRWDKSVENANQVKLTVPSTAIESPELEASVTLSPNPATTQARLDFGLTSPKELIVRVANAKGQIVYVNKSFYGQGAGQLTLPTATWARGMYSVSVQDEIGIATRKLILK